MKHGINITTTGVDGRRITPNLVVGTYKGYKSGDIFDANAVVDLIDARLAELVGAAPSTLDTLKEIGDAIPTKVSQLTNDSGFITTSGVETAINNNTISIVSNQAFPSGWPTTSSQTFSDLFTAMNADTDVAAGKVYLSTVHYKDLPSSLADAELKIEIMKWGSGTKIAVLTLTSANASPYMWQATWWNNYLYGWRTFKYDGVVAVQTPTISGSASFDDSTTITITVPDGTEVYYTINDSIPTTNDTLYTEPFTIDATSTIRAKAFTNYGSSDAVSETFTKNNVSDLN